MNLKEIFKEKKSILDDKRLLYVIVFAVMFVVYIFPVGLINKYFNISIPLDKLIFFIIIISIFIIYKISIRSISKSEIIFIILTILFTILTKEIKCLIFLTLLLLDELIKHKNKIIDIFKESKILYICVAFTIFYTVLYKILGMVRSDRYAFSAIAEINQSGLAIFCLSILLMIKNKKIGYGFMIFGLLTVSRSYFLAVILFVISQLPIIKKMLTNIKIIKNCNYIVLTVVTSIVLILIAYFYIYENSIGNVYWGDNVENRLINILDYSNLFRFVTNLVLVMIFYEKPVKLLGGLKDIEYVNYGKTCFERLGIPYKNIYPHNLFFSHLKIYGIYSFIETWYINKILKKIVTKNNFIIFFSIFLYSILLGAGLYSYWIFLTCFVLMSCDDNKDD